MKCPRCITGFLVSTRSKHRGNYIECDCGMGYFEHINAFSYRFKVASYKTLMWYMQLDPYSPDIVRHCEYSFTYMNAHKYTTVALPPLPFDMTLDRLEKLLAIK